MFAVSSSYLPNVMICTVLGNICSNFKEAFCESLKIWLLLKWPRKGFGGSRVENFGNLVFFPKWRYFLKKPYLIPAFSTCVCVCVCKSRCGEEEAAGMAVYTVAGTKDTFVINHRHIKPNFRSLEHCFTMGYRTPTIYEQVEAIRCLTKSSWRLELNGTLRFN